jgi:hypothetical protein
LLAKNAGLGRVRRTEDRKLAAGIGVRDRIVSGSKPEPPPGFTTDTRERLT